MSRPSAAPAVTRIYLARAALLWERAWPALAPALGVIGVFFVLALFDLLPLLPTPLHALLLLIIGALLAALLWRAARAIAVPDENAGRRRIEQESGLRHRPLEALADRPAGRLDGPSLMLWAAHRRRMAQALRGLKVGWPKASLAARDPWALRALLALLFVVGAADAGGEWQERLWRALVPNFEIGPPPIPPALEIWIAPPEYTGLPPRFLHAGEAGVIPVPAASKLFAQVHSGNALPYLAIDGERRPFVTIDKENFRAEATLRAGRRIAVTEGGTLLGGWRIRIVPDKPPTIAFARPPRATAEAALRIDYRASDDYGVERAEALIRRPGGAGGFSGSKGGTAKPADGPAIRLPLPLYGPDHKRLSGTDYLDLTASPWAGLPVEIRLLARDAIGQEGESAPLRLTLPERAFSNRVARRIIALRKKLVADPGSRLSVAKALAALNEDPQLYGGDRLVFLALRVAAEELRTSAARTAEVVRLLWQTALRLEEGRVPAAQARLRRLEQKLKEALGGHARPEEIERLMNELQAALRDYLAAMAQNLERQGQKVSAPPPSSHLLSGRDLERMIEQARELAQNGDRAAAQRLLSELENMLENLRMMTPQQRQALAKEQAALRGMRDLIRNQEQLLDKSFRARRESAPGENGRSGRRMSDAQAQAAAGDQEALRARLGEMMRRLAEGGVRKLPPSFGRAAEAMREAAEALRQADPGRAIGPQTQALSELQEASRQLARKMARALGMGKLGAQGQGFEGLGRGGQKEADPFGRQLPGQGSYDESDVKIPTRGRINEAHKILDELRRRAGEPWRPPVERRYIERLLEQF